MQIQFQLTPRRRKGAAVNRSGPWPFDTAGVTSCSGLHLRSHCITAAAAAEPRAPQHDAPGPGIPGRLKSQHPQIPQQEKTINQLFLDGLLMIKALCSPQRCDSDSSALRESGLAAASPAWQGLGSSRWLSGAGDSIVTHPKSPNCPVLPERADTAALPIHAAIPSPSQVSFLCQVMVYRSTSTFALQIPLLSRHLCK